MAEFLIKAIDATHPDSTKDKAGCYKRGDIVVVMSDGHEWGKEERLPKFMVVKIPDLSVNDAQKYIKEYEEIRVQTEGWSLEEWNEAIASDNYGKFVSKPTIIEQGADYVVLEGEALVTITRRKHSFLVDDTPSNIKDELNAKGEATVTWNEIKSFVKDKLP